MEHYHQVNLLLSSFNKDWQLHVLPKHFQPEVSHQHFSISYLNELIEKWEADVTGIKINRNNDIKAILFADDQVPTVVIINSEKKNYTNWIN